ncbi:SemiSWEET family sugar transporter [Fundidesulfovibrio putealis]|uniref:SemiSWEET family sugar transporter n=1 Tax=Fundidesulfovibrio putealis TaxID=270496 RepID=UPI0005BA23F7|nr:SemiSWEET transporter [Fundidesulfovibrio putealis]
MDAFMIEVLGLAAGCMTTCSFIPQVVRTYRSRSVSDISLRMYLLLCAGIAMWVVYGLMIGSVSVVAANSVSLCLTLAILVMKIKFRHERNSPRRG